MIPLLDGFIDQLESRFKTHKSTLTSLYNLICSVCSKKEKIIELYQKFLNWDSIEVEFQVSQTKRLQQPESDHPTCAIEALGECNKNIFPNIHQLLKILATLRVSTSTSEKTFSTMRNPGKIDWLGINFNPSADQHQHTGSYKLFCLEEGSKITFTGVVVPQNIKGNECYIESSVFDFL
ncbi:hypothetical protein PR048_020897 [Dryococelus australis]|uniref:Uncharacterized protein n=1 Tax=Dryococelus australis TaxID=614101 RepID=A0ABQ9GWQ5_9NEOP|nr:hypothetical protein PR048_020897 [Dryococelus australis]